IINQAGRRSQLRYFTYQYVGGDTWQMWGDAYKAILRSNFILTNIDNLPAGEFKDNMQGEALAVRALAHFDMLRLYAKSYTSASDTDPGVPYVTSTNPTLLPARTPLKQAYGLVVNDLEQATDLLNETNGVGRIHKAAAEALLSRVYLYMGEWQKCVDEATKAIADVPAENSLATIAQFSNIWIDATEKDVLFKVKNLDADNTQVGVGYKQGTPEGVIPEYSVDFAFYQLFRDADVRKQAYIRESTVESTGETYNYVYKYNGRPSGDADIVDLKVIRMGEVYLNRAEAYFNLTNPGAALDDLNTLRSNRYTDFDESTANETGADLSNAIQLERRLELAFEGARFFDLKRQNKAVQRSNFGDRVDGSGPAA
ncbi:MAG: RagB/SusD family nutrient uptake outer membrane protein, partial [Sphingobacteriales bacterium]